MDFSFIWDFLAEHLAEIILGIEVLVLTKSKKAKATSTTDTSDKAAKKLAKKEKKLQKLAKQADATMREVDLLKSEVEE